MKADLKCETTDLLQSRQKGNAEAELPTFGNEGRVLVEKPIFRSLTVKIERKCRSETANLEVQAEMKCGSGTSHLWKSWQNKCGKRNFRSLAVKAGRKCGSRTSHIWQSRQSGSAEAELHIFGSQCRTKVRTWNFRSLAVKAERKRNFRSLAVKAERKCGRGTSGLWQSRSNRSMDAEFQIFSLKKQSGSAEAALQIFDSPVKLDVRTCGRGEADLNKFDRPVSY